MWYIHTMEYYLAIKITEVLIHATTWVNLENIILSERSQTTSTIYCVIPFIQNFLTRQIIETESSLLLAYRAGVGWGVGGDG